MITDRSQYQKLLNGLLECSEADRIEHLRNLCLTDLFFLIVYGCNRPDADNEWVFQRSKEIQVKPDGFLDLWAREHYKSTIITFGLTIQDILRDPELTFGFFSHTRPIAKGFLRPIKWEFERNERLKEWFPDVLYAHPHKESPKWSEDDGIIVKRKSNTKECTIEAWGLVDGQPTSKHFKRMVYDDVVTRESVTTPDMIKKVTEAWELSRNLSSEGGSSRYIGTRYHYNDTYSEMIKRGIPTRVYAATKDGNADGEPVLMTRERLAVKRMEMQETFSAQMLLKPRLDKDAYFKREWFNWYKVGQHPKGCKTYGASDYAVTANGGDYTVHGVCAVDGNDDIYVVDWWRRQTESHIWVDEFIKMGARHKPMLWAEEAGQINKSLGPFILQRMRDAKVYFRREQFPSVADKASRGRSFQARASMGKVYLPEDASWIDDFLIEVLAFPLGNHDDQVDVLGLFGRILDQMQGGTERKTTETTESKWAKAFARRAQSNTASSWKGL
ncbi:MAG: phage terminase large subunit [Nitrospiraceae bacterium]|nr:phage terminase large subunit [Nitrospiraceae bacterium]